MSYRIRLSLTIVLAILAVAGWLISIPFPEEAKLAERESTVFQEEHGGFGRAKVGHRAFHVPGEARPQPPSSPSSSPRVVPWGAAIASDEY